MTTESIQLPTFEEARDRVDAGKATALDTLIYNFEPALFHATRFREPLAAALAEQAASLNVQHEAFAAECNQRMDALDTRLAGLDAQLKTWQDNYNAALTEAESLCQAAEFWKAYTQPTGMMDRSWHAYARARWPGWDTLKAGDAIKLIDEAIAQASAAITEFRTAHTAQPAEVAK